MIVDQEAQGCASVAAALEVLAEREPELRERFRLDKLDDPRTCPNCGAKDSFT